MPNIQKVERISKRIIGLQVRTKNTDEMNADTHKIAPLWARFYDEVFPSLREDATVYSVYHNYASDAQGEFDVLVGADVLSVNEEMTEVTLVEGRYLVFRVKGEFPQAIIDGWEKVWAYFEDPSIDEKRSFETDFEVYNSTDEMEIYIGVNYL